MLRRTIVLSCALALAVPAASLAPSAVSAARAAEVSAFTPAAFEVARKAGGPILVEVTAPWCPTCKAQKPILAELTAQPKFDGLAIFTVDFDTQKDALRALGVRMQSTLIAFKGDTEVARTTGVTEKAAIAAQLDKAL